MKKKKQGYFFIVVLVLLLLLSYFIFRSPWKFREDRPIKILYLNSYGPDLYWANDAISAFEEVFYDEGIEIDLRRFDMDTRRKNSEEDILLAAENAKQFIDEWEPDLIYASDDNAQKYVVVDYINTDIPFVFSGVGAEPEDYGFDTAENVAGVLERYLLIDMINLMRLMYPYSGKAVFVTDNSTTGDRAIKWFEHEKEKIDIEMNVEVVDTFEDYQELVLSYQEIADFFVMRGLDTFRDEDGDRIPAEVVMRWTVENSRVPEIANAGYFSENGFLSVVEITPQGQGRSSAKMAIDILINGESPSDIPFVPSIEGKQYINLKRAEMLELDVPSVVLVNSEVIEYFPWD